MILVENRRCELIRENRRGKFETDSVIPQNFRGLGRSQSNSNTSIRSSWLWMYGRAWLQVEAPNWVSARLGKAPDRDHAAFEWCVRC